MRKLSLVFLTVCLLCAVLTGCIAKRESITSETFIAIVEEAGFSTQDASSQYEATGLADSVIIAVHPESAYQIEFFDLINDDAAKGSFETNKATIKSKTGTSVVNSEVSGPNYEKYSEKTDGSFRFVSRINDTFVFLDIPSEYKDDVLDLVEKLGYK